MDNSMQRSVVLTLGLQQPVNTSGEQRKHQMDLNTSETWAAHQQMKSDMQGYVCVYTLWVFSSSYNLSSTSSGG